MDSDDSTPDGSATVGRPFPKGVSGNPGGRPKGLARRVRDETDNGVELVDYMLAVFRDESASRKDRMEAATWLADRGFGKPTTTIAGADGGPLEVMTTHVRESAERFLASVDVGASAVPLLAAGAAAGAADPADAA